MSSNQTNLPPSSPEQRKEVTTTASAEANGINKREELSRQSNGGSNEKSDQLAQGALGFFDKIERTGERRK